MASTSPWQQRHFSEDDALSSAITASLQPAPSREEEDLAAALAASLSPAPDPEDEAIAAAISASMQPLADGSGTAGHVVEGRVRKRRRTKGPESADASCLSPGSSVRSSSISRSSPGGSGDAMLDADAGMNDSAQKAIDADSTHKEDQRSVRSSGMSSGRPGSSGDFMPDVDMSSGRPESSGDVMPDADVVNGASEHAVDTDSMQNIDLQRVTSHQADADGWIVVAESVINLDARQLRWLNAKVKKGKLCSEVYTGAKTCLRGVMSYARTEPSSLSFGAMPEVEPEFSTFQQGAWLHVPGSKPCEQNFNFQRVWVQIVRGTALQRLQSFVASTATEVRITAEWNPALAAQHMATRIGFHAAEITLGCKIAPIKPPGWKAAVHAEWFRQTAADDSDEENDKEEFFLSGCGSERRAAQPPRFRRYKLRPEQLRSLQWMLQREAQPACFESEMSCRFVPGVEWDSQPEKYADFLSRHCEDYWDGYEARSGFSWCYEPTLQATFRISGGVLGDAIGTGKTATLIGLLDSQHSKDKKSMVHPESAHLITTNATLILVPSNLLGQWQGEFTKFLGPDAFKFLVIRTIRDLRQVTLEELRKCDIVLTTFKLLYSADYSERLRNLACTRANHLHERSFFGDPIQKALAELEKAQAAVMASSAGAVGWTKRVRNAGEQQADRDSDRDWEQLLTDQEVKDRIEMLGLCKDLNELTFPVFELFFWNRIVFDEFHELEAMDTRRQYMLQNLRSKYRWGLTGTPPKRDKEQIVVLARMLRVRLAEEDPAQCQHFLDVFVRQNFSELPEIPVNEHIIHVQQTMEERAIYLQEAYEGDRRTLLQFCSHHCLKAQSEEEKYGADGVVSAKHSVAQLEAKKHEEQAAQKTLVRKEYEVLAALSSGMKQGYEHSKAEADLKKKLMELEDQVRATGFPALHSLLQELPPAEKGASLLQTALSNLESSRAGAGNLKQVLRMINGSGKPNLTSLRQAMITQLGRCHVALAKLLSMTRSIRFFEATLNLLGKAGGSSEVQECPICLDELKPETTALLPCAHAFHADCVHLAGGVSQHCPTCRAPFKPGEMVMVSTKDSKEKTSHQHAKDVEQFGSKLVSIAKTLRDIRAKEPGAKAIVFVQWKSLEVLVGRTLQEMGIDHIRLVGAAMQRSRLIADFQEKAEPRVLLQSLENSASGANLTRASHVLLVHPMDASSKERAVSYEMQALGRVRRCGQEAKEVHLYRFVTKNTIEEEISQEHQLGVSSRIQAGQLMAASSAGGS